MQPGFDVPRVISPNRVWLCVISALSAAVALFAIWAGGAWIGWAVPALPFAALAAAQAVLDVPRITFGDLSVLIEYRKRSISLARDDISTIKQRGQYWYFLLTDSGRSTHEVESVSIPMPAGVREDTVLWAARDWLHRSPAA